MSADKIADAENVWYRVIQRDTLPQEHEMLKQGKALQQNSRILKLDPYFDKKSRTLRVGGSLQNSDLPETTKHPIIVRHGHSLTENIINRKRQELLHAGPEMTSSALHQNIWLTKGRRVFVSTKMGESFLEILAKMSICISCIIMIGDVVLILDDNVSRGKWPMGRVEQIHPRNDGYVRAVTLHKKGGAIQRPVQRLHRLEVEENIHANSGENVLHGGERVSQKKPTSRVQTEKAQKPIKKTNTSKVLQKTLEKRGGCSSPSYLLRTCS